MTDHYVPIIAIDGPSGSGKGSLCVSLAEHLEWSFLDSGALYRVLAYVIDCAGAWDKNVAHWAEIAASLDISFPIHNGQAQAFYAGESIEHVIRTEEVAALASRVATVPRVREALLSLQRSFARKPGLVADGRDMGTVVFPGARLKVFLTASAQARAERRYLQLKNRGRNVSLAALLQDIQTRDERDRNRRASPLVPAEDAVLIDSTDLSIEQVIDRVIELARQNNLI